MLAFVMEHGAVRVLRSGVERVGAAMQQGVVVPQEVDVTQRVVELMVVGGALSAARAFVS